MRMNKYLGTGLALAVFAICFSPIVLGVQGVPTIQPAPQISTPPSNFGSMLPSAFYAKAFAAIRSQPLTIAGQQTNITPGSVQSYNIVLTAPYQGQYNSKLGNLTTRFGAVALVDKNNNILSESGFMPVNETYTKTFTVTIPTGSMTEYVIVAGITETLQHYTGSAWVIDYSNKVIQQEALALTTKVVIAPQTTTAPTFSSILSALLDLINNVLNAFKALFGL